MTRGKIDPIVVRRHLAALREALAGMRRHSACSAQQLAENPDLRWAVERGLQLCAQNVLDIATHITTAAELDSPDYASTIDRLTELGVLPAEFAARLRLIAGFRNVLVHGYLRVDLAVVEKVLAERLPELEQFARYIDAYLQRA
ncbi:MAG: DUF86 domain-containing protein [Betaproteobacteria bacterium]|nr:DUF86 domain-containing protein [Betaproteobacteria bacterium]